MKGFEEPLKNITTSVESYLNGISSFDELKACFKANQRLLDRDKLVDQVFHMAIHFEDDQDIIKKEPEYREYMKTQVLEALEELKNSLK